MGFAFFRSLFWPPRHELCHFEIQHNLQRNTMLESHKSNIITNKIVLMMMLNSISTLQCKVSPIRIMGMTAEKYKITFKQIQFNQKYHHPEKYSVSSSQILANWKLDQPDDFEQFASARSWFQPHNSKLVPLEIWGYLQRNTASVPHKYLWIWNKINPMMISSSLPLQELDFILPIWR